MILSVKGEVSIISIKKKKVVVIGHFGGDEDITDGQTVKTKVLYSELQNSTNWQLKKVDTYYKSKNPIKLFFNSVYALFSSNDIIVLLSGNGMKFYFPILFVFVRVFHKRIYHDVIGGNLDVYVKTLPQFRKYLNSFVVNWVETNGLKERLEKQDIENCEVIPNFKRLKIIEAKDIVLEGKPPYRFCTFSRVMKEKGIEEAISAVEKINSECGDDYCSLDIYGLIDENYTKEILSIIENKPSIKYCGIVPYDKSVETLKDYYALLFPTYWQGEGFPGTIIDAFSAGLPVIASYWNENPEIIENGMTGILIKPKDVISLYEGMKTLISDHEKRYEMSIKCLNEAKRYQPEKIIKMIVERINRGSRNSD